MISSAQDRKHHGISGNNGVFFFLCADVKKVEKAKLEAEKAEKAAAQLEMEKQEAARKEQEKIVNEQRQEGGYDLLVMIAGKKRFACREVCT